ncbi:Orange carotenoid protein [Nostoc sp. FACHB-152]|uniref:orange carotenoid protein N-terminal domain-containing protein n=1 Tax=unclassified Nostoc TaxID=2593658 RepID=UPI0016840E27|nr:MULTISPECIES: orange carotenoid protein N-terminal domain-containing protein [unclassified Nostoc]MBD2451039.1 Orange carotenoid protein [Nostoc sp. FACHB-152]MBD2471077.1 Orange carotenoid protein [Nostoc sp. FACHB-145]
MTYATDESTKQAVEQFRQFDVDTKLALLWFGYLDIKEDILPAQNEPAEETTGQAVYDHIQALPQEQQLQAQRDLVSRANSDISRAYSALHSSGKLNVWLRLAQGIEGQQIITVPSDYELPQETQDFVENVENFDLEQRIDFMRSIVQEMGAQ